MQSPVVHLLPQLRAAIAPDDNVVHIWAPSITSKHSVYVLLSSADPTLFEARLSGRFPASRVVSRSTVPPEERLSTLRTAGKLATFEGRWVLVRCGRYAGDVGYAVSNGEWVEVLIPWRDFTDEEKQVAKEKEERAVARREEARGKQKEQRRKRQNARSGRVELAEDDDDTGEPAPQQTPVQGRNCSLGDGWGAGGALDLSKASTPGPDPWAISTPASDGSADVDFEMHTGDEAQQPSSSTVLSISSTSLQALGSSRGSHRPMTPALLKELRDKRLAEIEAEDNAMRRRRHSSPQTLNMDDELDSQKQGDDDDQTDSDKDPSDEDEDDDAARVGEKRRARDDGKSKRPAHKQRMEVTVVAGKLYKRFAARLLTEEEVKKAGSTDDEHYGYLPGCGSQRFSDDLASIDCRRTALSVPVCMGKAQRELFSCSISRAIDKATMPPLFASNGMLSAGDTVTVQGSAGSWAVVGEDGDFVNLARDTQHDSGGGHVVKSTEELRAPLRQTHKTFPDFTLVDIIRDGSVWFTGWVLNSDASNAAPKGMLYVLRRRNNMFRRADDVRFDEYTMEVKHFAFYMMLEPNDPRLVGASVCQRLPNFTRHPARYYGVSQRDLCPAGRTAPDKPNNGRLHICLPMARSTGRHPGHGSHFERGATGGWYEHLQRKVDVLV